MLQLPSRRFLALRALQVRKVPLALLVQQVLQGLLGKMGPRVLQAPQVRQEKSARQVLLGLWVLRGTQVLASKRLRFHFCKTLVRGEIVRLVRLVHKERLDPLGLRGPKGPMVPQVPRVRLDLREQEGRRRPWKSAR